MRCNSCRAEDCKCVRNTKMVGVVNRSYKCSISTRFLKLRIKVQFHQTAPCIGSRPCFLSESCRCPSLQLHFLDVFRSHECNEQSLLPNSNWSYENREHQLEILERHICSIRNLLPKQCFNVSNLFDLNAPSRPNLPRAP